MAKGVIRCSAKGIKGAVYDTQRLITKGSYVQQVIDLECLRYMELYEPKKTGTLISSAYSATTLGSGEINIPVPYAHFQYVGYVRTTEDGRVFAKKGEAKPILTDRELKHDKSKNSNAQKEWFEVMKRNHIQDILAEAKAAAKRGNRNGKH